MTAPAVAAEAEANAEAYAGLAGFCDGVSGPDAGEYAERVQRVQAAIGAAKLKAVVCEPGANMAYLAGVRWGPVGAPVPRRGAAREADRVGVSGVRGTQGAGSSSGRMRRCMRGASTRTRSRS